MKVGAIATAAALLLTACSGEPETSQTDSADGPAERVPTLTIMASSPPPSMDPAGGAGPFHMFQLPIYDVLFNDQGIGQEPSPALAESFEWIGEGSQELKITLRDGVMFSDGTTPLDSAAVKTSIEYFKAGSSGYSQLAAPIESIETPDDLTVIFHFSQPTPTFVNGLAEEPGMGSIINPTVIESDPESLGTVPAGAGPYVLSDRTVPGSEYRYEPNENYYNPDAILYDEIIIRVASDPNTALAAVQTGQADITFGSTAAVQRATDIGLNVRDADGAVLSLLMHDWEGKVAPALADVRVRQALNYAIDREAIAAAATHGLGEATTQATPAGSLGYSAELNEVYPYDPERARELLEEAGYPDGFSMPVVATGSIPTIPPVAQAFAAQLAEIGITVDLTITSTAPEFAQAATTPNLYIGAIAAPVDRTGLPGVMNRILSPTGGFNSTRTEDPELTELVATASALSGDEAQQAWIDANTLVVEQALLVPMTTWPSVSFYADTVADTGNSLYLNPLTVTPAS